MVRREREGRTVPAGFRDRPELPEDLTFVWEAFWHLHTERQLGMGGQGPIPRSAILLYAGSFGMGSDETRWFAGLIAAMDDAYFAHQRERREVAENLDKVDVSDGEGVKRVLRSKAKSVG